MGKYCSQGHNQYFNCFWNEFSRYYKRCPCDVLNCGMSPFLETTSLIVFGVWDFTPDPLCMYKSVATPLNPTEVQMGTCDCEMTLPDKCIYNWVATYMTFTCASCTSRIACNPIHSHFLSIMHTSIIYLESSLLLCPQASTHVP